MRIPLILLSLTFCFTASAAGDAGLRHLLSLLGAAKIGDDYQTVAKLAPGIGPLRSDAGENNTEALMLSRAGDFQLHGEFNFSKGRLVSHGFRTGELTHAQAHDLLLQCVSILTELYGASERRIELPNEHDGARDAIGISFNWVQLGTRFGLDLDYRRSICKLQWGAQSK